MEKIRRIMLIQLLTLSFLGAAQAQTTIDVSKITCDQFRGYKVTNPNNIAIWLSGYYGGQQGTTIVQVESFRQVFEKLKDYCITRPDTPVMQAAKIVLKNKDQ